MSPFLLRMHLSLVSGEEFRAQETKTCWQWAGLASPTPPLIWPRPLSPGCRFAGAAVCQATCAPPTRRRSVWLRSHLCWIEHVVWAASGRRFRWFRSLHLDNALGFQKATPGPLHSRRRIVLKKPLQRQILHAEEKKEEKYPHHSAKHAVRGPEFKPVRRTHLRCNSYHKGEMIEGKFHSAAALWVYLWGIVVFLR